VTTPVNSHVTSHAQAFGKAAFTGGILLAVMLIGVIVFPGTGIQANLADKAKTLGIPVCRFGGGA
jgi:multisubunit Na+/H+ antiporter MnhG subunit